MSRRGCRAAGNRAVGRTRDVGARPEEDERHQQVVPDPQELEDGERAEGRDRQRQDDADERLECVAPSIAADSNRSRGSCDMKL